MGKNKNEDDLFCYHEKNKRKTKQCFHDDICTWNRDSFSREVENYKGNRLHKDIKKENFKTDLINLVEKNHPINMLDHTVDSNSISNTKYAGFSAKW